MSKPDYIESICWTCANACGGCSWADDFIPVDGWTAKKDIILTGKRDGSSDAETYSVIKCPEYVREMRHKFTELDNDGVLDLARRVLTQAGKDYLDDTEIIVETEGMYLTERAETERNRAISDKGAIERFLKEGNLFTEVLNLNGERMLNKIQKDAAHYEQCGEWA